MSIAAFRPVLPNLPRLRRLPVLRAVATAALAFPGAASADAALGRIAARHGIAATLSGSRSTPATGGKGKPFIDPMRPIAQERAPSVDLLELHFHAVQSRSLAGFGNAPMSGYASLASVRRA
ncbi:hypothetical protein SAMN05421548_117110 [Paraburkholderia lycopersici]|uniref:Uncharacterized protein n=2 Tax=Paraburkholderia lycopersici TaxID=416944 RepID=A0A1G6TR60_9BURK|nr:hypothetical protein SAMN05421548_117110 [Paraburkholderia lycopersici]